MKARILVLALLPALASAQPKKKGAEDAKAYIARVNVELKKLIVDSSTAEWIRATYITDDTERNAAAFNEKLLEYRAQAVKDASRYVGPKAKKTDADTTRSLYLLRTFNQDLVAPADAAKRTELANIAAKMGGMYGKAKGCGRDGKGPCKPLLELEDTMAQSRKWDELLDTWIGWHNIGREMRPMYRRFAELGNEGARGIGFADLGELWRARYDMSPADLEKETERLWQQVKPLYTDLHCKVRNDLAKVYGADKVPAGKPIPAHILGNMWAQEWTYIYPLVEPYKGQPSLDVEKVMIEKKWDHEKMTKIGESFFTSIGLDPLPKTFWERSMLTKPRDREVECHASAWDVIYDGDLRIKMCIRPREEDLITIHHELGHVYYYMYYHKLPILFQDGAHDGFHEAIGDALTLSMTPAYYKQLGLLGTVPKDEKGVINVQMKSAMEKVAFLPFGRSIDQWRWDVFNGKIKPADYNKSWWELRQRYQGIAPAVARTEEDFDPGAKYHIPANTPYLRYFLARILQFQFHRALCRAADFKGPLHECSIYGNKAAGAKLKAMLEIGSSKPWADALEAMTGERQMDAGALLEYYAPLQAWLKEQNKGQTCGW
jgi:peptidyl-dipeptidase A